MRWVIKEAAVAAVTGLLLTAAVGAAEPSRCESGSVVCMATQVAANFISRTEWNA